MKKKIVVLVVFTIIFTIAVIYYFTDPFDNLSNKKNESEVDDNLENKILQFPELDIKYKLVSLSAEYVLPRDKSSEIKKEITMSNASVFVTSNGSAVVLPSRNTGEFTDDMSWLIVYPMKRNDKDQIVQADEITKIRFRSTGSITSGGRFSLKKGTSICVGISSASEHYCSLAFGEKYIVSGYFSEKKGNSTTNYMLPFEATLVIPKDLERNKVYEMEIVLRDELEEKRIREEKEAEEERKRLIAERDKITVHIEGLPTYPEHKHWHVHYYVNGGKGAHHDFPTTPPSPVILKGPLQLGGELNVFYGDGPLKKVWAQVRKVQSRNIILPDQADWLRNDAQLIEVNFQFVHVEYFQKLRYPSIYLSATEDSILSLYTTGFDYKMNLDDIKEGSQVSLKMMPGAYYVKSYTSERKKVSFGIINVTSTNNNQKIDLSKQEFLTP